MAAIAKATSALPGVAEKSDASSSGGGESSGGISLSGIKFSDKGLCPDLTITQRFGGFLACFGLGIFFFMMAHICACAFGTVRRYGGAPIDVTCDL